MKRYKLTKNAITLLGVLVLILMFVLVINFGGKEKKVEKEPEDKLVSLLAENQVLKVELLEMVSDKNYIDEYQEISMKILADEKVLGHTITNEQSFNKVMRLLPPDENSPLLNHSSERPTHEAYIIVLTGDIAEYRNSDNKIETRIVNARLEYYKQSLLLENAYDSVYIASIDGRKEKMVKINAYKEALSDPKQYMSMLQW